MPHAQIVDVVSFMPERVVVNRELDAVAYEAFASNPFFAGVEERRFASPDYSTTELGVKALQSLLARTGVDAADLDAILCSCQLTEQLGTGVGPAIQHAVGARNATILNFDTGCASYLSGLNAARAFIESGIHDKVAVVTATNVVSRLDDYGKLPQSWPLGDGASATLLAAGESSFLSTHERSHGENYGILKLEPAAVDGFKKSYWECGCGPLTITFSIDMLEELTDNALSLVPAALEQCLSKAQLSSSDVSLLITHQPNAFFISEWRRRISIGDDRSHDTLAKYGNLFHGSIPVTIADALEHDKIHRGDVLALGTFSHGGDFVSAMVLRWV